MSREGDLMRQALRRHLVPALAALGFEGGPTHFRRFRDARHELLSIQWWKYGGSFILEFGHRARGPLHTAWGEVVDELKLDVAYLPLDARARLQDRQAPADDLFGGFAFAGFGEDAAPYHALAERVAARLPQVDAWLREGRAGPDIALYGPGG